jgi:hypothetical protein
MSQAHAKKQQKLEKLFKELANPDDAAFNKALETLATVGDNSVIAPVAKIMFSENGRERRAKIADFFANISQTMAREEMIRVIQNEEDELNQAALLNTIWNSRLDYSSFLPEFVDLAIDGSFEIAIECHTIIEQMDGPFDEAQVLECQLLLGAYKDVPKRSAQKDLLIADIAAKLGDIDADIEG